MDLFYYEQQVKRDLKGIHICGCQYNERLKTKTDGSTRRTYTVLCVKLEHLKKSFECVMGECVI